MLRADIECLAKTFRVTIRGSLLAEINAAGKRLSFFTARPATSALVPPPAKDAYENAAYRMLKLKQGKVKRDLFDE
jgi:hypothetical protein